MPDKALFIVLAASALDAALACFVLFRARAGTLGLRPVSVAALAVGASGAVKVGIALRIAHSFFLAINLVYTELMLVVPITGLAILWMSRRRIVTRPARALAWASLVLVPIGIDATFVEPYRLVTERAQVTVPAERALARPIVVGVLADLQCLSVTDRERDVVARVMAARPDMILVPGDLQQAGFDHRDEIAVQLAELLAPLHAPLGVWYVEGNTETTEEARHLLAHTPVRILENEIVHLDAGDSRVTLCGLDLGLSGKKAAQVLRELQEGGDDKDVRILLAHRPDAALILERDSRVDLVVSGHTHGGQVQLPWIGPLITLSRVSRAVAAGGCTRSTGTTCTSAAASDGSTVMRRACGSCARRR